MEHRDDDFYRFAFEAQMTRYEVTIKRLIVTIIVAVALLFASNVAWLLFFNQFDFESKTVMFDTDDGGDNSYIGNDGEINNGFDDSKDDNSDTQEETQE